MIYEVLCRGERQEKAALTHSSNLAALRVPQTMGAGRVHAYRLGANQPEATFSPVFQMDRFLMVVSDLYTYRTYIVKLPIRRNCKKAPWGRIRRRIVGTRLRLLRLYKACLPFRSTDRSST